MMQRRMFMTAALAMGGVLAGCSTVESAADKVGSAAGSVLPKSQVVMSRDSLFATMQNLWQGHLIATRNYALAVHAGDPTAAKKAMDAEVANGHQIADAAAAFYGKPAGEALFKLLAGHVQGVNQLTVATQQGNRAAENQAMSNLTTNAMDIAKFLAGANPQNWTVQGLDQALMMHVGDHKLQIDLMMANAPQAQQDQAWQKMQEHMMMIADALSNGIAKQFPEKLS